MSAVVVWEVNEKSARRGVEKKDRGRKAAEKNNKRCSMEQAMTVREWNISLWGNWDDPMQKIFLSYPAHG